MTEPRLKTEIWVKACIRRAGVDGIAMAVVRRGDSDGGAVLVKLNRLDGNCTVFAETRDVAGARARIRGTGTQPVPETEADAYIARSRRVDPDIWVLEIEDRQGRLPFDAKIL